MDAQTPSTLNVKAALDGGAAPVFLRFKTGCPGCLLARFCTLADVARNYRLDDLEFYEAVRLSVSEIPKEE